MMLIAQNHLQLILEVGAMLFVTLVFCLNLIPLSLSVVTFLSLFLAGGFTLLFGADILLLIISSSQNEFTHPFGPIALMAIVSAFASLKVMKSNAQIFLNIMDIRFVYWIHHNFQIFQRKISIYT